MTAKRTENHLSGYIGATVEEAMKMSKATSSSGYLDARDHVQLFMYKCRLEYGAFD
jgi:hypothetical protein